MIHLYLVTGFLGAGKTTLMQSILRSFRDRKTGVIVNDFGEINVDAHLIDQTGIDMVELSNGSIFCACIKDKFIDSLIRMSDKDIEFLFIEASGLADPANMRQIIETIEPWLAKPYSYRGSVCIVDGENFLQLSDCLVALKNQVAYANAVILNKADLIDSETILAVCEKINTLNEGIPIHVTTYCDLDIDEITERLPEVPLKSGETTNTYAARPASFLLKTEEILPLDSLTRFIGEIAPDSFRIKGFARTDQGGRMISCAAKNISIDIWNEPLEKTEIVVVSAVGMKLVSRILDASKKHLSGRLKL